MSQLANDLNQISLSHCNTVRAALTWLVKSEPCLAVLNGICSRIRFKEFGGNSNVNYEVVNGAIEAFLESGNVDACAQYLDTHLDTSEPLHDLLRDAMNMREYSPLVAALADRVAKRFPETKKIVANLASEAAMDAIINIVRERDTSTSLDALKGVPITVAFVPNFGRHKSNRIPVVSYFSDMKDATTIAPDQTFRTFMSLCGIDKDNWLQVVKERTGVDLLSPDEGNHTNSSIARIWRRASWKAEAKPLLSAERLFEAIDTAAHGFSPMLAFSVDCYRFVKRDWAKAMTVSGGIIGLHDFDHGTGDPVRFDVPRVLAAQTSSFILPELQSFGIAHSHGFSETSFQARMKDSAISSKVYSAEPSLLQMANDIVTLVKVNFGPETIWGISDTVRDMLALIATEILEKKTGVDPDAIISGLDQFDEEDLASLLVGLQGRDHAMMSFEIAKAHSVDAVPANSI